MADHNDNIVTFRQAPDDFCADRHNARWGAYRYALYRGVWLDQYRDDEGNSTLLVPESTMRTGRDKRGPGDRSNLISLIPTGNFWVPETVSDGRRDDQVSDEAYEAMAELPPEDYVPGWRQAIMEPLGIARADLDHWQQLYFNSSEPGEAKSEAGSRVGRPSKDWDGFYREVIRIANMPDGLPDGSGGQSRLETRMLEWCERTWGKQPGLSTVRGKLGPLYDYLSKHPSR